MRASKTIFRLRRSTSFFLFVNFIPFLSLFLLIVSCLKIIICYTHTNTKISLTLVDLTIAIRTQFRYTRTNLKNQLPENLHKKKTGTKQNI